MIWLYGALSALLLLGASSAFTFYKGYSWASSQCNEKFYKAQITAYKRLAKNAQDALSAAKKEEDKETAVEKSNDEFIKEIENAINKPTKNINNTTCVSSDFLHKLRNLR